MTDLLQSLAIIILGASVILNTWTIRRLTRARFGVRANLTDQKTPGHAAILEPVRDSLTPKRGGQ